MYTDYTDEENSEYEDYYDDNGNNNNNIDKEKIKKIAFFVLAFVILVVVIILIAKGCSGRRNSPVSSGNQTPSISLNRESYSVSVGEEVEIYADVQVDNNDNPIVGWQTEDSNIATVEDLGENHALVKGVKEGSTNIVAIYRENGRPYSNKCQITVTSTEIKLEKIDITQEEITLNKGKDALIQVKLIPENAKVSRLVYTSDDSNIASVSEEGRVSGINYGTTTITVKTEDGTLSDSVMVNVTNNGVTVVNPTSIQLGDLSNGLKVGGTATINYTILPSNATNRTVTWSSTNPSVATVNSNGLITGVGVGTTTIMVSTSNGVSASREITVEANTVPVTGVTINTGKTYTMTKNGTKLLSYTVSPSNATNKKVSFTTSNRNIVTVDSNGIMGARNTGVAVISVITEDGKKTATITITVIENNSVSGSQTGNSTGGTGSSSSGSSSSGSTSSGSTTCDESLMTYITHNGPGAIISQYSFSEAKAFQNMSDKPTITFTQISDCVNTSRLTYKTYYGTTSSNVSTLSSSGSIKNVGDKITLNNGNGYYRIELLGYTNSNQDLRKNYYAIVQNGVADSVKPYINSLSVTKSSSTRLSVTTSINENGSGLKNVKYCLSSSTTLTCTPYIILFSYTTYPKSNTLARVSYIDNGSLGNYKKICVNATDANNNTSTYKCVNF